MSYRTLNLARTVPLLAAGLMLAAGIGAASAADFPTGIWAGGVPDGKGHNIVVKLTVPNTTLGTRSPMRWNAPKNCSLTVEYAGMNAGKREFRVASSDGGWCDLYRGGSLMVEPEGANLGFRLTDKNEGAAWKGVLRADP